jgi:predicted transcriptional regulator
MSNENEIVKKIQKRMKDVLSEHNFTKEECANKFGISRNQLYVLLNHPDMKISFIIKFKEIFNIEFKSINDFERFIDGFNEKTKDEAKMEYEELNEILK